MNEEPPTPFDTVGDAPVEARIVAWVLGEASAFEAAELERLCEERPELLVFRRRMRALHGLLTEAEAGEADHSWKLPPERREVLDEIFGEEKISRIESQKELRIRRSGLRAFLAIAACVVLAVVVLQLIHPIRITQGGFRSAEKTVNFMPASERPDSAVALRELNKAVRDQEDKVEERRKVLSTIVRTKGVIYKGQDSFYDQSGVDEDQGARSALQTFNALEKEKAQLQTQLQTLNETDAESQTKANVQAQLAQTDDRLKKVEVMKDDTREEAIKRGLDAQDYADAKRDFESDQQLLQALKLKQIEQTIAKNVRDEKLARNNAPAPTSAASAPASDGTYRLESRQSQTKTGAGVLELKEQSMLAKRSAKPAPEVAAVQASEGMELPAPAASPAMPQLPEITASGLSGGARGLGGPDKSFPRESGMIMDTPAKAPAAAAKSDELALGETRSRNNLAAGEVLDNISGSNWLSEKGKKADASESEGRLGRGYIIAGTLTEVPSAGDKKNAPAARPPVLSGKDAAATPAPSKPSGGTWTNGGTLAWDGQVSPEGAKAETAGAKDADEAPIRKNAARTAGHTETNERTRRTLYTAEGNLNLGKYDEAKKHYQEALKADPENSAARLGLEKAEAAKSDYYRAAYDHTRAELLSQVDSTFELTVPADKPAPSDAAKLEADGGFQPSTESEPPAPANEPPPTEEAKFLAELANEIPAAETPYSTFSLNISDASFQLAKAALAKGERPDSAGIKPEQFYNAVDYGDPAPASNEPVAATIEQSAHPVIPGRNLVRVALRTGSVGRSAVQPLRLTLLVDQSGSMVREDRRASMEHALSQLGILLTKADLVTVIGFSRTPHLLADGMTGDQALKLSELVNQTASEGGTNLEEAMKLGGQLAERHQLAGAQNRIVLFTDGAANLGDANPVRLAEQVKAFRQKGLAFDIAGIGADGLNDRLLSELARNGNGRYYVVGNEKNDSFARQLAGAFRPAAENVKVQVNFNPQRVGNYKLIGFEKDRLKTEDFRNDAVDAAELAAEEAGVAIYQVEPLADGTGEIGEVSVRFRDAASKEMVERTWTMPYDSQATAFDRATPSMQLAGLSLLAAEKLKGGPLADAIDFKQLAGPTSLVKQFYASSPRVADMLRVIDALK